MDRVNTKDHLIGAVTIFLSATLLSITLFLIAFVTWFSDVVGSLPLALTLVGGVMAFIAILLYYCSVRPGLRRIYHEVGTIYEVAQVVQSGYSWIIQQFTMLLK